MNKATKGSSAVYVLYRTLYGDAIGGDAPALKTNL